MKKQSRFTISVKKEIKDTLRKMKDVRVDVDGDDILVSKDSETIILKAEYL